MVHPCLAALSLKKAQNAIIVVCYSRVKLPYSTIYQEIENKFKISVLSDFNSLGATRTAKKYKINSCLIYKWKAREADWQKNSSLVPGESLKRIKICKKFMSDHQKEVLDYYLEHGIKPTMEMFAIKQKKLHNWRKRFNDQYNGKLYTTTGIPV